MYRSEKGKLFTLLVLMISLALVSGCDGTPYDLTVQVTDADDNVIWGAVIILSEVEDLRTADQNGQVTWTDLENETVTLIVTAQGYQSKTVEVTLGRGHNEEVVALEQAVAAPDPSSP